MLKITNKFHISLTTSLFAILSKNPDGKPLNIDFEWSGRFGYVFIEENNMSCVDPISSPLMTGGVFAINRNFFWKNGGYDTGRFPGWGGENFELSFKTWLCGGRIDVIPCSHVAHLDRPRANENIEKSNWVNLLRVANIWMDEYKSLVTLEFEIYYGSYPHVHNIEDQLELKKTLNCKPFSWYVENVIPEKFIPERDSQMHGRIRNGANKEICFDNLQVFGSRIGKLGQYSCNSYLGYTQYFALSKSHELRVALGVHCAEVSKGHTFDQIKLSKCNGKLNQKWKRTAEGSFKHLLSEKCITPPSILHGQSIDNKIEVVSSELIGYACVGRKEQTWEIEFSSNSTSTTRTTQSANGRIRNGKVEGSCLDDYSLEAPYLLRLYPCIDTNDISQNTLTQIFDLTINQEIRHFEDCAEVVPCDSKDFCTASNLILMTSCNGKDEQKWKRTKWGGLKHVKSKLCLAVQLNQDGNIVHLFANTCNENTDQMWKLES